jgi:hypothetical protein
VPLFVEAGSGVLFVVSASLLRNGLLENVRMLGLVLGCVTRHSCDLLVASRRLVGRLIVKPCIEICRLVVAVVAVVSRFGSRSACRASVESFAKGKF